MLTRDNYEKMDETPLRIQVLIPLLRAMGFRDVYLYHGGSGELGKDIICWKPDELGIRQNLAVVAKAKPMSGKAQANKGSAAEVQTQIRQCFGEPYTDSVAAEQQDVHRVWVVSNKKIGKEAVKAIKASIADLMRTHAVRFIDGDQLWELIEQHLPSSLWHFIEEAQKRVQTIDTHYEPEITLSGSQTTVVFREKFPGAAKEKPIKITPRFVSQEAAEQFHASLKRSQETGEPTVIPADLIASVDIPDFLQGMLGTSNLPHSSLRLSPLPNPNWTPVKISLKCDDGDNYVCHFVRLKPVYSGTKQSTIINEPDDVPFDLEIVLRYEERKCDLSIHPRLVTHDAAGLFNFLTLCRCLSKSPTLLLENLKDGTPPTRGQINVEKFDPPNDDYIALVEMLAVIQKKTGCPIIVPERDLTDEEVELIQEVHFVVTVGRMENTWGSAEATFQPDLPTLESFMTNFADGKAFLLFHDSEEVVTLFGNEIPLGKLRHTLRSVKCMNYSELVTRYEELRSGTATISLHLEPGADDTVVREYQNWLADDASSKGQGSP